MERSPVSIVVLLLSACLWSGCQGVSVTTGTIGTSTGAPMLGSSTGGSSSGARTTSGTTSAASTGTSTGSSTGGMTSTGGTTSGTSSSSTGSSSGTTTGALMGTVTTFGGGETSITQCALPDGGVFGPNGLGALSAGGVYVATQSLDLLTLDGGLDIVLTGMAAEAKLDAIGMAGPGAQGVAVSTNGNVYATAGLQLFQVTGSSVTFLAGNGIPGNCDDSDGDAGAGFISAQFMTADSKGNVYVTDDDYGSVQNPHCTSVRKVTPDGTVMTLAGTGQRGFNDGPGSSAMFNYPGGLAADSAGNVYVTDSGNQRIRKITPDGTVSTLAGNGKIGFTDGTGGPNGTATFNYPSAVAVDSAGNVFVADTGNASVREIAPDGTTTTLAGNGTQGDVNGTLGRDGTTEFVAPNVIAVDGIGNVYVGDYAECALRLIHIDQ